MKLSKIKQQLHEKNASLPEEQRRVRSVRNMARFHEDKTDVIKEETEVDQNPTLYQKNNQLLGLDQRGKGLKTPIEDNNIQASHLDTIKMIGITGSKGKSTTAYLVHEYLKSVGYRSVLYSSIMIDSPASFIKVGEACETPLNNENVLMDIIEEAESYEADYIVLEINESAIAKGLTKDIPFTVRALTNIFPTNNTENYSPSEYVALKQSFFENIPEEEDCTSVFGMTGTFDRVQFNELLKLNNHPKITYGSQYICEKYNADYTNLDCLLYGMENDLTGLELKIRVKDNTYDFKTEMIVPHNAMNITCSIAILEALTIFNPEAFQKCIRNIKVPGREEVIRANGRTIVIGYALVPALGVFKQYKDENKVGCVKVISASHGTGYIGWSDQYQVGRFTTERSQARRYAMDYIKKNADYVYITSNDNAAENPLTIAQELQGYLNGEIPSVIEVDRKEAIRKAITESLPNDLIYISGRGNRRVFCDTATSMKLFLDKEIVLEVLKELGW